MTGESTKARPNIDLDNKEFWDGLSEHQLLLWRCGECGAWYWPKAYCTQHENQPFRGADELGTLKRSGADLLRQHHQWVFDPNWADDTPFAYVLVELEEGPLISSTLIDKTGDAVGLVGRAVEVVFEDHLDVDDLRAPEVPPHRWLSSCAATSSVVCSPPTASQSLAPPSTNTTPVR